MRSRGRKIRIARIACRRFMCTSGWRMICKTADIISWIVISVTGLGLLHVLLLFTAFDTFHVPSHSMTPTLNPGDRGIINKLKLGGRYFNIYAAAACEPFEIKRMPGYGRLERGDIIVFNAPFIRSWDTVAMDMRRYYCKRAVAVAGDTLETRKGHYHVRGHKGVLGVKSEQDKAGNIVIDVISNTPDSIGLPGWIRARPKDPAFGWTLAEMGPIVIPREGMRISMDYRNTVYYKKYIEWESGKNVERIDSATYIGGIRKEEYVFRENYCFAAGDHVIDSQDSRYWGLVPEKFIVGTVALAGNIGF